jgi:hypothetical protein
VKRHAFIVLAVGYALAATLTQVSSASAQQPAARRAPFLVRYGKWAALGAAIGFGALSRDAHHSANAAFQRLENYCLDDIDRCNTGPGGKYLDPVSEHFYQQSLSRDGTARSWLFATEGAVLGAAALFVWELAIPRGPPKNIPFEPKVGMADGKAQLGVRVSF